MNRYIPNKFEIAVEVISYSEKADDIIKFNSMGRYLFENKPLDLKKMENILHRYFRDYGWHELYCVVETATFSFHVHFGFYKIYEHPYRNLNFFIFSPTLLS